MSTDGGMTSEHYVIIPMIIGTPFLFGSTVGYFGGKYYGWYNTKEYMDVCEQIKYELNF